MSGEALLGARGPMHALLLHEPLHLVVFGVEVFALVGLGQSLRNTQAESFSQSCGIGLGDPSLQRHRYDASEKTAFSQIEPNGRRYEQPYRRTDVARAHLSQLV